MNTHLASMLFNRHVLAEVYANARAGHMPADALALLQRRLDEAAALDEEARTSRALRVGEPTPFPTHPSLHDRLRHAAGSATAAPTPDPRPAVELLNNLPALSCALDRHLHEWMAKAAANHERWTAWPTP